MSAEFRPFDLTECRDWPELHALVGALDAFARRAGRETQMTETAFERALPALARALCASDTCDECNRAGEWVPHVPHTLRRDRARFIAAYRCEHGHEWTCGWGSRERMP